MSYARRHRRDKNHKAMVETLEAVGCTVLDLSQVGDGCPDLCVGLCGHNYLVEVKSSSDAKLTDKQLDLQETWRGQRPTVVWNCDQAREWALQLRMRILGGSSK